MKTLGNRRILILAFILLSVGKAEATRYWASTAGGAASCAAASGAADPGQYRTLNQAISCATASGDELYIKPGTYTSITLTNNTIFFDPPSGITVRGSDSDPANWPVLAPSGSAVRFVFFNATRSNVTLKYLKMDYVNATSANGCIGSTSSSTAIFTNIVVEDVECKGKGSATGVNGPAAWGLGTGHRNSVFRRTRAWNFHGMRVENLGPHCFYIQGDDNIIEHNECDGFYGYAYQLYSAGTERPNNNILRNNLFKNLPRRVGYIQTGTTGNVIHNNIFHTFGANDPGNTDTTIRGTNTVFAHNVLYTTTSSVKGLVISSCSGCQVFNNIISVPGTAITNNAGTGVTLTTNKISSAAACMIDPANGDFNLLKSSACIDAGTSIGASGNWPGSSGRFVGSAPDQGAFEAPITISTPATPSSLQASSQ